MNGIEVSRDARVTPTSVLTDIERLHRDAGLGMCRAFDRRTLGAFFRRGGRPAREHRAHFLPNEAALLFVAGREIVFLAEIDHAQRVERDAQAPRSRGVGWG